MSDSEINKAGQCAEHYFAFENIPNCPLWTRRCMLCGAYDSDDMNKQLADLIAKAVKAGKIEELNRLDHDKQMFGDWQQVIADRIATLETEETL